MRPFTLLITLLAFAAACDKSSDDLPPPAPVVAEAPVEAAPEPEPPPNYEFEKHPNALRDIKALEYIPPAANFVAAAHNPTELFELLGAETPEPTQLDPRHAPELWDLHPARMKAAGLDAERPAGIAIFGDNDPTTSESWVIFANLADEDAFRRAFNVKAPDKRGIFAPQDPEDHRRYLRLADGEVLISQNTELVEPSKSLATDEKFKELVGAVNYGNLGTVYLHFRRGAAMFGLGHGPEGFGVKVFADDEMFAATLRLSFWELGATANPLVIAHLRVINPRAERHPQGAELRAKLDRLVNTPIKRRLNAAKTVASNLEEVGSLESNEGGFAVAGRMWRVDAAAVAAGFREWVALGLSNDELQERSDLEESLRTMSFVSKAEVEDMTNLLTDESIGMGEGVGEIGNMFGMGGMLGGGDGGKAKGKGKGKGKQPGGDVGGGMLGNLAGLDGFLGGGKGDDYKSDVRSDNPALRDLVKTRMASVGVCYGRYMDNKPLSATVALVVRDGGQVVVKRADGGTPKFRECMIKGLAIPGGGSPKEGTVRITISK